MKNQVRCDKQFFAPVHRLAVWTSGARNLAPDSPGFISAIWRGCVSVLDLTILGSRRQTWHRVWKNKAVPSRIGTVEATMSRHAQLMTNKCQPRIISGFGPVITACVRHRTRGRADSSIHWNISPTQAEEINDKETVDRCYSSRRNEGGGL